MAGRQGYKDQYKAVNGGVDAKKWIKEHAEEFEFKRQGSGVKPLRVMMNGKNQYFMSYNEAHFFLKDLVK